MENGNPHVQSPSLVSPSKKRKRQENDHPEAARGKAQSTSLAAPQDQYQHAASSRHLNFDPIQSQQQQKSTPQSAPFGRHGNAQNTTSGHRNATAVSIPHPNLRQKARNLDPIRKALPIWAHATEICSALRRNDVLILVGETGSGKSTQVPHMLLAEPWCAGQTVSSSPSNNGTAKVNGNHHGSVHGTSNGTSTNHATGKHPQSFTVGGCIAITQPRRVAAITLARRVADEMGSPLGTSSPASKVGYSVRFDHNAGPATRVKFLTEGMLLREMSRDPWLRAYSVVVVDEVHERGVNVDLVLGFLKSLMESSGQRGAGGGLEARGGVKLKVVVMSATAEMEHLKDYFTGLKISDEVTGQKGGGPRIEDDKIPTVNGTPKQKGSEQTTASTEAAEEEEWSGFSSDGDHHTNQKQTARDTPNGVSGKPLANGLNGKAYNKPQVNGLVNGHGSASRVATCHIEGRQYPVKIHYTPEPVQDFIDAAFRTIFLIHHKEPLPGDILVFVTGQETVESLEALVKDHALNLGPEVPKLLVLPLFAALPQAAQQSVFSPTPPKTRKVIIATNIAETSVTVSGVRFVVDCGKAKIKQFRSRIGLESLLVKPISKSAAIQRKGRAGREAPGQCYRLYTEQDYLKLPDSNTPEILRCDLSHSILDMKAKGIDDVLNFPFLDQPSREALEKALLQLYQLGALNESGSINNVGLQISKFPLSVPLGRALIAAAQEDIDCISEVIDVVSCLSVENLFLNITSEEKKEEAEEARKELMKREGDHLTLLATIQAYGKERNDRKSWANRHFVSHRAMQAVMDVRKQLRALCQEMGFLKSSEDSGKLGSLPSTETANSVLKAFLKGFSLNTARLCPDGSYRTLVGNQTVAIHPASGLFGRKVEAIMYNEFVFTNRSYARGVSAVQMDWIAEAMGA